jgi:hypothetical protein
MQFGIQILFCIRSEVLTGSDYEDFAFWNVKLQCLLPRSSGYYYQNGGSNSSETMVPIYKTTHLHIPEEIIFSVTMKKMTVYQRTVSYSVLSHSCETYFV